MLKTMHPRSSSAWFWILSVALGLTAACDGFRAVEGPDARANRDGPSVIGGSGPGPMGALPTGYCCTGDDQCRHRSCRDFSGVRMCSDPCHSDSACEGNLPGFHCADPDAGERHCAPKTPGLACRPAQQFTYGGKGLGACCVATHDNRAGLECLSGRCVAWGDNSNPYYCASPCGKPSDCPGAYVCFSTPTSAVCKPSAETYTCTP